MSSEIMAACLEEATVAWFTLMGNRDYIWSDVDDYDEAHESDKQAVATLAAALYQERMKHAVPVVSHAELEPPSYQPVTTTWGGSGAGNKGATWKDGEVVIS